MSGAINAIYLQDTKHVVATYSTVSGRSVNATDQNDARFRQGLTLRRVPQTLSRPITTTSAINATSSNVSISSDIDNLEDILVGDRCVVGGAGTTAEFVLTDVTPNSTTTPFTSSLTIKMISPPSVEIPANQRLAIIRRSPADENFRFDSHHFEIQTLEQTPLPVLSRPHAFSVDSQQLIQPPGIDQAISITFKVSLTGVEITLELNADQPITQEVPAVCALRTSDKKNVVSTGSIRKSESGRNEAKGDIPFAAIPGDHNFFLFMVKGLPPIWDKLKVNEQRTWSLT